MKTTDIVTIKVAVEDGARVSVLAQRLTADLAIHPFFGEKGADWRISDILTGRRICSGQTRENAIRNLARLRSQLLSAGTNLESEIDQARAHIHNRFAAS